MSSGLAITRLSDVEPQVVRWLWPGRLPMGKVTVLDGDPEVGKSLICLDLASRVTAARAMPDGSKGHLGSVLLLNAEDGLGDTIRPRIDGMGGNPRRVITAEVFEGAVERPLTIPDDLGLLRTFLLDEYVALVIIDPLTAFLGEHVNTWSDHHVRRALHPLAQLAEETMTAMLVVRHLNKGFGKAIYRGGGSIAIGAAARVVLMAGKDPTDPERRVLAVVKNNLAPHSPALAYRIAEAGNGAPRVEWLGESDVSAEDLCSSPAMQAKTPALQHAKDFLSESLAAGPQPANEVEAAAASEGIKKMTLRRAKRDLGVQWNRIGGRHGHVSWLLPSAAAGDPSPKMLNTGNDHV